MVGHTSGPGPYVIRVKASRDAELMPHRHPEDRINTVMSGVFYIGLGDQFDGDKVQAFPPGGVITDHFHWAKSGEYMTQVTVRRPSMGCRSRSNWLQDRSGVLNRRFSRSSTTALQSTGWPASPAIHPLPCSIASV
jgi:hypothetical protein